MFTNKKNDHIERGKIDATRRTRLLYYSLWGLACILIAVTIGPMLFPGNADWTIEYSSFWTVGPLALCSLLALTLYSVVHRKTLGKLKFIGGAVPGIAVALAFGVLVGYELKWAADLAAVRYEIHAELRYDNGSELPGVQYFRWGHYKHLSESEAYSTVNFSENGTGPYKLTRTKGEDSLEVHFWNSANQETAPLFSIIVKNADWAWSNWREPSNKSELQPPMPQIRYRMRRPKQR